MTSEPLIKKLEDAIHTGIVDGNAWGHGRNSGIRNAIDIIREHEAVQPQYEEIAGFDDVTVEQHAQDLADRAEAAGRKIGADHGVSAYPATLIAKAAIAAMQVALPRPVFTIRGIPAGKETVFASLEEISALHSDGSSHCQRVTDLCTRIQMIWRLSP